MWHTTTGLKPTRCSGPGRGGIAGKEKYTGDFNGTGMAVTQRCRCMKVLVNSLLAMAMLMALVGILGLMSTMSMNIMERTKEIGVMRAVGGTPGKIRSLIVWEGLITGIASIGIAFILSIILSYFMGKLIGNLSFRTALSLSISVLALIIWITIILVGSYVATLPSARRANRMTTREALAYE